jgi:hypothetical protein
MADNEGQSSDLLRIKVDATGAELAVGSETPKLLARLVPAKYRLRGALNDAMIGRIIEKVRDNGQLDENETAFADRLLSDEYKKCLRLADIQLRAETIFQQNKDPKLLGSTPEQPDNPAVEPLEETSDDWLNKFRDDASLVDDDLVREIYARILAEEARSPRAFSLRTLGVLRYLDRQAATDFGNLQKVVFGAKYVPEQTQMVENDVLRHFDITHEVMLRLEDCGLVNASAHSWTTVTSFHAIKIELRNYNRFILVKNPDGSPIEVRLRVHLLTPAGRELSQISECEFQLDNFNRLISWLRTAAPAADFYCAELPHPTWEGSSSQLTFHLLEKIDV